MPVNRRWTHVDIALYMEYLTHNHPEATITDVQYDQNQKVSWVTVDFPKDQDYPDDYGAVLMNTFDAVRSGYCSVCLERPASRSFRRIPGMTNLAGVCHVCYQGDGHDLD